MASPRRRDGQEEAGALTPPSRPLCSARPSSHTRCPGVRQAQRLREGPRAGGRAAAGGAAGVEAPELSESQGLGPSAPDWTPAGTMARWAGSAQRQQGGADGSPRPTRPRPSLPTARGPCRLPLRQRTLVPPEDPGALDPTILGTLAPGGRFSKGPGTEGQVPRPTGGATALRTAVPSDSHQLPSALGASGRLCGCTLGADRSVSTGPSTSERVTSFQLKQAVPGVGAA